MKGITEKVLKKDKVKEAAVQQKKLIFAVALELREIFGNMATEIKTPNDIARISGYQKIFESVLEELSELARNSATIPPDCTPETQAKLINEEVNTRVIFQPCSLKRDDLPQLTLEEIFYGFQGRAIPNKTFGLICEWMLKKEDSSDDTITD